MRSKRVNSTALCTLALFLVTPVCLPETQSDVCTFYQQRLESKLHCGLQGYPLAYGKKYCERFRDLAQLSRAGAKWRDETLSCLQSQLGTFATNGGSCDAVREKAFASHASCYKTSGFCQLPVSDWRRIFHVIDWTDLLSAVGLRQIGMTLKECYDKKVDSREIDPRSADAEAVRAIIATLEAGKPPRT